MIEEFKAIEGYEGLYEVSNLGRVRSVDRWVTNNGGKKFIKGQVLKPRPNHKGYLMVGLCKEGKVKNYSVHRLVAKAFLPNPENLPCVNHISEDKTDNRVENIEYCDIKYNNNFGTRNTRIAEKIKGVFNNDKKSKTVQAFNKNGNLIFEFPSTQEAERNGFNSGHISSCCKGKLKTHKGLVWKYA